jgi:hypothetical protein
LCRLYRRDFINLIIVLKYGRVPVPLTPYIQP